MERQDKPDGKRTKWALLWLGCALVVAGCGGGSSSPASTVSSKTIGASGGVVTSANKALTLNIPAGALDDDVEITISKLSVADLGPEFEGLGALQYFQLAPSGITFNQPVKVSLTGLGNPLIDTDTFGGSAFLLLTADDLGNLELLDNPAMHAVLGSKSTLTVAGELSHFSPLVMVPGGWSGSLGSAFDFSVDGVPNQVVVNEPYTVTFEFTRNDIPGDNPTVCPAYISPPDDRVFFAPIEGTCSSATAPGSFALNDMGGGMASASAVLYCDTVGDAVFKSIGRVEIGDLNSGHPIEFAEGRPVVYTAEKAIACVNPDPGDEPPVLQTGLFTAPLGMGGLESIAVVLRPEFFYSDYQSFAPEANLPIGLLGSDTGSASVDLQTSVVVADNTSEFKLPLLGAGLIAQAPEMAGTTTTAAALFEYGTTAGGFLMNWDDSSETFGPGGNYRMASHTDSTNVPPGELVANEMVITSDTAVNFIAYDSGTDSYAYAAQSLSYTRYGSVSPLSATARMEGGALLVLTSSGDLYFDDRSGDSASLVGSLGSGPKKIRCTAEGGICVASLFADDKLVPIMWDGINTPTIGTGVSVGDGPVDIALHYDADSGNTLVLSTGFNDDTVRLTEVDASGAEVSNTASPVPPGCEAPGHVDFILNKNTEAPRALIGTCYDTGNYFVGYYFF